MNRHSAKQVSLQRVVDDDLARRAELEWDSVSDHRARELEVGNMARGDNQGEGSN
jgi:hypothetical protein